MSWRKSLLFCIACACFSHTVYAEKTVCPVTIIDKGKVHIMNSASLFDGPPEERAELLPDTDEESVWTLEGYQQYPQERGTSYFLVCLYDATTKTIALKVPATAKTCSAILANDHKTVLASCE